MITQAKQNPHGNEELPGFNTFLLAASCPFITPFPEGLSQGIFCFLWEIIWRDWEMKRDDSLVDLL